MREIKIELYVAVSFDASHTFTLQANGSNGRAGSHSLARTHTPVSSFSIWCFTFFLRMLHDSHQFRMVAIRSDSLPIDPMAIGFMEKKDD